MPSTAAKATRRSAKLLSRFIHWMAHEAFSRTAGMVWIASKRSLVRFFFGGKRSCGGANNHILLEIFCGCKEGGTPRKTNMTMEKTTMNEYVSPIKNGDFPASHVSFQGGYIYTKGCRCGVPHRFARWNHLQPCLHDLLELLMFQSIGKQVTLFLGWGTMTKKIGMTKKQVHFCGA